MSRCSRASGARPRDRLLPAGVRPLVHLIDIASSEWPLYVQKQKKRKGKARVGWDERFLAGEWDVTALTSEQMRELNHSLPCLSGGRALASLAAVQFRAAQQLPQEKNRSQLRREGRRRAQREHRVLGRPKLSGKHRPRLPDSLRKLYGAGEETQKRLFGFMDCGGKRDMTQFKNVCLLRFLSLQMFVCVICKTRASHWNCDVLFVATECVCNLSPRHSSFLRTGSTKQTATCNHSATPTGTSAKSVGTAPAVDTVTRKSV